MLPLLAPPPGAPSLRSSFLPANLPPGFTFARASKGWYFDAGGTLQQAANDEPRLDHDPATLAALGTLLEPAGTNYVRNPRAEGAVAGTPGTNPTNWTIDASAATALSWTIVGTGVEDGIPYVDVRWFGTSAGSGGPKVAFDANLTAAAATGQTWTASVYLRLLSGSPPAGQLIINEYTGAGALIVNGNAPFNPTAAALRGQRYRYTRTLSGGASVAACAASLYIPTPLGTVVDFTLRIGLPQLEQQAWASSVILPPAGSPAVTTRATDSLTLSLPYAGCPGAAGWSAAIEATPLALPGNVSLIGIGTTSFNDTSYLLASASNTAQVAKRVGGGGVVSASLGALAAGAAIRAALAQDAVDARGALNGGAVQAATYAGFPTATIIRVGDLTSGSAVKSPLWLRSLRLWGRKLSDAELMGVTR